MSKKIDIFSDMEYYTYQHINHFIYQYCKNNSISVRFFYKAYMNGLSFERVKNLVRQKLYEKKAIDTIQEDLPAEDKNIIKLKNFPPSNKLFILFSNFIANKQLKTIGYGDIAITFSPSKSLDKIFKRYKTLVYYCVHNIVNEGYKSSIIEYEKELIEKSNFIICDNADTLDRIRDEKPYRNLVDEETKEKTKFFLVPSPIPDEFFEYSFSQDDMEYDFVYFGSIHKYIDLEVFSRLANEGYKILVISNEELSLRKNITRLNGTHDINKLITMIDKARYILFPYTNDKFMETITPAKIFQSMLTKKPIICSNKNLTINYKLISVEDFIGDKNQDILIEKYRKATKYFFETTIPNLKVSNIIKKVIEVIS